MHNLNNYFHKIVGIVLPTFEYPVNDTQDTEMVTTSIIVSPLLI